MGSRVSITKPDGEKNPRFERSLKRWEFGQSQW
jgi:hypothetical protein